MTISTSLAFPEQFHGYKNGHQLLASSLNLGQEDQDTVDRLSDISGQLRPGERFSPYLSGYPLPSQSFYVIAITRQDLDAPRAGCVRTHSLFIPMKNWTQQDVSDILREVYIRLTAGEAPPTQNTVANAFGISWPPVQQSWVLELVEATFLEQRAPTVVFDGKDTDLVAFRLLAALWPSARSAYSVCTFALAPRSIVGKSFDLVFAPKTARSRFSEWTGRRIDAAAATYSPRHRWAPTIAQAIFEAPRPNLDHFDDLGLLLDDRRAADESQLRMALLWKELSAAARSSPQAVLGLVDIFMTAKPVSAKARDSLAREFRHAVTSSSPGPPNLDFWQFIIALLEKFNGQPIPEGGTVVVRLTVRERVRSAPRECLSALADVHSKGSIPKIIAAAIGDGLSDSDVALFDIVHSLGELGSVGTEILASSKSLGPHVISSIPSSDPRLSDTLRSIIFGMNSRYRRVFLRRSVAQFNSPEQADILNLLLQDTTLSTFSFAMLSIGENTQFKLLELNLVLVDAAKRTNSLQAVQNALVAAPRSQATGRTLAETLSLSRNDFAWLQNNVEDDWYRAWVISLLVDSASEDSLKRFASIQTDCSRALLTLSREGLRYSTQMTRLLVLPEVEDATLALYGVRLAQETKSPDRLHSILLSNLIRRLVGQSELLDAIRLRNLVEAYAATEPGGDVADILFTNSGSALAVVRALQACHHGSDAVKRSSYRQIEMIANRVLRAGFRAMDQQAITALAELLEFSGTLNRYGQARASGHILNACFESTTLPVGNLVTAAFPVVYSEVKSGSPGFTLLNLFFPDWDHCKTIRRKLADSYIHSIWPPIGLLICAWRVNDVNKVFRYLQKSLAGRDYLRSIQEDLHRYGGRDEAALSHVFREIADFEWVEHDED